MFEIVLFPIDRSRQAAETAAFALKLAQQHDSRLVLLSVVEPGQDDPAGILTLPILCNAGRRGSGAGWSA